MGLQFHGDKENIKQKYKRLLFARKRFFAELLELAMKAELVL